VAAVSRTYAGHSLGKCSASRGSRAPVYPSGVEALANPCDVFVEYTKPESAKGNILAALERGVHVVVGPPVSLTAISQRLMKCTQGRACVLACGNFALTVVLLQRFAEAAGPTLRSGASILSSCASDDLPCGMSRAAASANRCSSTTVKAKLPQARTPRSPCVLFINRCEIAVSETGGPTTTCTPRSSAARMLPLALSGFVYSTKTSHDWRVPPRPTGRRGTRAAAREHFPRECLHKCARPRPSVKSSVATIPRASSEPAHPVAPARQTLIGNRHSLNHV